MKSVSSLDSLLKERIFLGWYIMFSLAHNRAFPYLRCSFSSVTEISSIELEYRKVASSNTSPLRTCRLFQIAYEGDFWSLCTVTFGQKVDFLNSNTC